MSSNDDDFPTATDFPTTESTFCIYSFIYSQFSSLFSYASWFTITQFMLDIHNIPFFVERVFVLCTWIFSNASRLTSNFRSNMQQYLALFFYDTSFTLRTVRCMCTSHIVLTVHTIFLKFSIVGMSCFNKILYYSLRLLYNIQTHILVHTGFIGRFKTNDGNQYKNNFDEPHRQRRRTRKRTYNAVKRKWKMWFEDGK